MLYTESLFGRARDPICSRFLLDKNLNLLMIILNTLKIDQKLQIWFPKTIFFLSTFYRYKSLVSYIDPSSVRNQYERGTGCILLPFGKKKFD